MGATKWQRIFSKMALQFLCVLMPYYVVILLGSYIDIIIIDSGEFQRMWHSEKSKWKIYTLNRHCMLRIHSEGKCFIEIENQLRFWNEYGFDRTGYGPNMWETRLVENWVVRNPIEEFKKAGRDENFKITIPNPCQITFNYAPYWLHYPPDFGAPGQEILLARSTNKVILHVS